MHEIPWQTWKRLCYLGGMIIDEIEELWEQRPFVPFEIAMADGSVHRMENPKWMMLSADERTLKYVNRKGPSHKLAVHLITRVSEPAARARGRGRKRG